MRRLVWLGVAFLVGYVYGRVSAFRMPIDEYHTIRMELEGKTNRLSPEEKRP